MFPRLLLIPKDLGFEAPFENLDELMASALGVLDVLSRLREESERAATAVAAQKVKRHVAEEAMQRK